MDDFDLVTSIYVSIASYRDPELAATVETLCRSIGPDTRLRIRILAQCPPEERVAFPPVGADGRIVIEQTVVDPSRARGVGWARAEIQRGYDGEDYHLQLDSHVQLAQGWDRLLRADLAAIGDKAPAILTAYLPGYAFVDGVRQPVSTRPSHFKLGMTDGLPTAEMTLGFPHPRPVRAWFYSAHFAFAPGRFIEDVPYDPEIFFMGEEIAMAIRAYAAGYELFTPSRAMGAHRWSRRSAAGKVRPLFWDAAEDRVRRIDWRQRERASAMKVAAICRGEWPGLYGIQDPARYRHFRARVADLYGIDVADAAAPPAEECPPRID